MPTLVEHPLSRPGGLLEESFQYCRGPDLRVRTAILKLVGKTWREKPMYLAEGTYTCHPYCLVGLMLTGSKGPLRKLDMGQKKPAPRHRSGDQLQGVFLGSVPALQGFLAGT